MTPAIPMPEEEELNMKFAELVVRTEAEKNFPLFPAGSAFFKFNYLIRGCFLELCTTGMRYRKCKIAFWHRIL